MKIIILILVLCHFTYSRKPTFPEITYTENDSQKVMVIKKSIPLLRLVDYNIPMVRSYGGYTRELIFSKDSILQKESIKQRHRGRKKHTNHKDSCNCNKIDLRSDYCSNNDDNQFPYNYLTSEVVKEYDIEKDEIRCRRVQGSAIYEYPVTFYLNGALKMVAYLNKNRTGRVLNFYKTRFLKSETYYVNGKTLLELSYYQPKDTSYMSYRNFREKYSTQEVEKITKKYDSFNTLRPLVLNYPPSDDSLIYNRIDAEINTRVFLYILNKKQSGLKTVKIYDDEIVDSLFFHDKDFNGNKIEYENYIYISSDDNDLELLKRDGAIVFKKDYYDSIVKINVRGNSAYYYNESFVLKEIIEHRILFDIFLFRKSKSESGEVFKDVLLLFKWSWKEYEHYKIYFSIVLLVILCTLYFGFRIFLRRL